MNLTNLYTEAANTTEALSTERMARAMAPVLGVHWATASDHMRQRLRDAAIVARAAFHQWGGCE